MIEALERFGGSLFFPTNLHSAVGAGIQQRDRSALRVSRKQYASTCNRPSHEVSRILDLRAMPEINPVTLKNSLSFKLKYFLIYEVTASNFEDAVLLINQDCRFARMICHVHFSLRRH